MSKRVRHRSKIARCIVPRASRMAQRVCYRGDAAESRLIGISGRIPQNVRSGKQVTQGVVCKGKVAQLRIAAYSRARTLTCERNDVVRARRPAYVSDLPVGIRDSDEKSLRVKAI